METGNWEEIKPILHHKLKEIFYDYDLRKLNSYEKRRIIFEFLCKNLSYDYELLYKIAQFNETKTKVSRNGFLELSNVIYNNTGICNAISQYYKLLLEEVGIVAYCVICDDGTTVRHQLNLVYDEYQNNYSFDDITSVIVGRGQIEEYFDYNLEDANNLNQGNKEVIINKKWFVLPEDYINYLVGKKQSIAQSLDKLPNNIVSVKKKSGLNK